MHFIKLIAPEGGVYTLTISSVFLTAHASNIPQVQSPDVKIYFLYFSFLLLFCSENKPSVMLHRTLAPFQCKHPTNQEHQTLHN